MGFQTKQNMAKEKAKGEHQHQLQKQDYVEGKGHKKLNDFEMKTEKAPGLSNDSEEKNKENVDENTNPNVSEKMSYKKVSGEMCFVQKPDLEWQICEIIHSRKQPDGTIDYYVHYTGSNRRLDE